MRLVLFSRVPRWYSFKNERLARRLTADGHYIAGVIVEKTGTIQSIREWISKLGFKVFLNKALGKLSGKRPPPATGAASDRAANIKVSPKVFFVKSHNSPECIDIMKRLKPDVLVLRGCGIIKKPVLDIPQIGTINPHYALLPAYRGMDVTEWSAIHGDPIAVSVHTVNQGVDTGVVLKSRQIPITADDSTGTLRDKCAALAVTLISEALSDIGKSRMLPDGFNMDGGRQYYQMHPRLKELADARIRKFGRRES